jgi:hypothetical protein
MNEHDVPVVLTAHHHIPDVERIGGVTEVTAPPSCSYPQAHLLFDVDREGTTVLLVPHADDGEQREAYDAFRSSSNPRSRFAGVASAKIRGAPLLEDAPRKRNFAEPEG